MVWFSNGSQHDVWCLRPMLGDSIIQVLIYVFDALMQALRTAMTTFREHKPSWEGLMKRGMSKDHTWDHAAEQYEQIFEWAFVDQPYVM